MPKTLQKPFSCNNHSSEISRFGPAARVIYFHQVCVLNLDFRVRQNLTFDVFFSIFFDCLWIEKAHGFRPQSDIFSAIYLVT